MNRWILHNRTAPAWNLATEEYFMSHLEGNVAMLWRNNKAVIIGRNQDLDSEVDLDFCQENGIDIVRRLSGGGAVFHDLGNINYTYLSDHSASNSFAEFARPLIAALAKLGITAELSGRNDILVEGKKISGCAHATLGTRSLYHGTLLFSADISKMFGALKVNRQKYESKGIKSVASRVGNLKEYLPELDVEAFLDKLTGLLFDEGWQRYLPTEDDIAGVDALMRDKYSNPRWAERPGRSTLRRAGGLRASGGILEAFVQVEDGLLKDLSLRGDFFGLRPVREVEQALVGWAFTAASLAAALDGVPYSEALHGFTREDILAALGFSCGD